MGRDERKQGLLFRYGFQFYERAYKGLCRRIDWTEQGKQTTR